MKIVVEPSEFKARPIRHQHPCTQCVTKSPVDHYLVLFMHRPRVQCPGEFICHSKDELMLLISVKQVEQSFAQGLETNTYASTNFPLC